MAKVSFTSLTPIKKVEDKIIKIEDKDIIVKQYLPVAEKAELIDYVIQSAFDQNGLLSPLRYELYFTIGLLRWYTNINFTETMLQNVEKIYDSIVYNKLDQVIKTAIPETELQQIEKMLLWAIEIVQAYSGSFAGQLRAAKMDYDDTSFDLEKIASTLQDPQQLGLVKELMTKMG